MLFFFFQAEDGIRDLTVTGVQTCALPISGLQDQHQTQQTKSATPPAPPGRPHPPWREPDAGRPDPAAQPHHSRVEQLLPDRGQCANLRALRPPTLPGLTSLGQPEASPQGPALGGAEILATPWLDLCGPQGTLSAQAPANSDCPTRQGARQSKSL